MNCNEIERQVVNLGSSLPRVLELAGISRATWWRWKTGRFAPRAASVERIKAVLAAHVTPETSRR
jgi:predicted DNA-binding transcriptional regulator AlpA